VQGGRAIEALTHDIGNVIALDSRTRRGRIPCVFRYNVLSDCWIPAARGHASLTVPESGRILAGAARRSDTKSRRLRLAEFAAVHRARRGQMQSSGDIARTHQEGSPAPGSRCAPQTAKTARHFGGLALSSGQVRNKVASRRICQQSGGARAAPPAEQGAGARSCPALWLGALGSGPWVAGALARTVYQ